MEPPSKVPRTQVEGGQEVGWSTVSPALLQLVAKEDGMRVLRAEEDDGAIIKFHNYLVPFLQLYPFYSVCLIHYQVPAVFLTASEVLAPLADNNENVLFSDDNVVSFSILRFG